MERLLKKNRLPGFLVCLVVLWFPAVSSAENPWTQTFYFENDLFTGTDRNYTNGVKYSLISPDLSPHAKDGKLPRSVLELIQRIPFIGQSTTEYTHKVEFSLGQNMFTPADIDPRDLIKDDRPYAGWTYISTSYHRKSTARNRTPFMDTVELQLGLIGPDSYAEEAQKLVHELRDIGVPNGWDNQLKNEIGLVVAFERKWLLKKPRPDTWGYSLASHVGGTLGNVHTYLNLGVEYRLGWNIPEDFGVSIIRPAGSTRLEITKGLSAYLFGAVNGKAVARDIFLDGNTFADSHHIDKNVFVANFAAGFALNYNKLLVSWTQLVRTKEFKNQEDSHSFGAIAVSYSFPFNIRSFWPLTQ